MLTRTRLAALTAALVLLPAAAGAQNRPDMSGARADRAALEEAARTYEAAWARADARAIAGMYSTDAMLLGGGEPTNGRADIQRQLAENFAGTWKGTTLRISPEPIEFVRPDVAIGYGRYAVRRGGEALADGRYMSVWVKSNGKWHLRANQAMVPAPAVAANER